MKNKDKWQAGKYILKNGKLLVSKDKTNGVAVSGQG